MRKIKLLATYAWKTLTHPIGTTFESHGRKVNRLTFAWQTMKIAWAIRVW